MADDPRFSHIATDPRFKAVPRKTHKVKVDSRFKSMFTDKQFKIKYRVDKRGRKSSLSSTENLKKYYDITEDDVKTDHNGDKSESNEGEDKEDEGEESEDKNESSGDEDSSSTDIDFDEINDNNEIFNDWIEENAAIVQSDEVTARLALCHMNWDRITAQDLFVLMNSFIPQGGVVKSVTIYPSDFGQERLIKEDIEGPAELVEDSVLKEGDNPGHIEGKDFSQDKLRLYQLNRLKYFYAIIECDSPATAEHIYEECDGLEYELSASTLDLRFVPDEMDFSDREVVSTATENSLTIGYQPSEFLTTALQQTTVKCTWDETHPSRLHKTMTNYNNMKTFTDDDYNIYIASSSDEEGVSREDLKTKYQSLLGHNGANNDIDDKSEDIEITWNVGLTDSRSNEETNTSLIESRPSKTKDGFDDPFFSQELSNTSNKKKKKPKLSKEETDRLNKEKAELELLVLSDNEEGREHFSLKQILNEEQKESGKKKRRKRKEKSKESSTVTDFEVDHNDPRFSALYESHHYAIEPTDSRYKATKGMQSILAERQKRRKTKMTSSPAQTNYSVKSLVQSVKAKTESFNELRKQRKRPAPF